MPLNAKGKKIKAAMQKQYGKKQGEQVFYASENKQRISKVKKKTGYNVGGQVLKQPTQNQSQQISAFKERAMGMQAQKEALNKRLGSAMSPASAPRQALKAPTGKAQEQAMLGQRMATPQGASARTQKMAKGGVVKGVTKKKKGTK